MSESISSVKKRAFSNPLLAILRLVFIAGFSCFIVIQHLIRYPFLNEQGRLRLGLESSVLFYRVCLRVSGIRLKVKGDLPTNPVLFTPNHISYMDILAMGASCPTFFVSKASVAQWPVIGILFRLSKSLTIDRSKIRAVKEVNTQIRDRISSGNSVCVFLEGTTSNGLQLLPFHASLLESVFANGGDAVPIEIQWSSKNPRIDVQEDVAILKKHVFGSHAFRILGLSGIEVCVTIGDAVSSKGLDDRKQFADALRSKVLSMMDFS